MTPEAMTLAELLDSYLREHLVRSATAETYRKAVKRWIEETAILYVDGVTREAVLAWRNGILRRARPETWNKYRRHMRALFNHALERDWAKSNPFQEVPPACTGQRLRKTVGAELVRRAIRLLESSEGKLRPGWFWAMVTGSGTPWPRCWQPRETSARCRNCWGTPTSGPPWTTCIRTWSACGPW